LTVSIEHFCPYWLGFVLLGDRFFQKKKRRSTKNTNETNNKPPTGSRKISNVKRKMRMKMEKTWMGYISLLKGHLRFCFQEGRNRLVTFNQQKMLDLMLICGVNEHHL